MIQTIEVRFKGNRRGFFVWSDSDSSPRIDEPVIVETEHGVDFGLVNSVGDTAQAKCGGCTGCDTTKSESAADLKKVIRQAGTTEQEQHHSLRKEEDQIRREVSEMVIRQKLDMRISDTEWQWDRHRLTIYFTADRRVDFRALVRELATRYRTRIELRQIGVRDEAARLGGIGKCGREFCCTTWLTKPSPVNLGLAKDQRLSLNPSQISGGCGRLLCCLKYEHEFYLKARKRFPKEGKTLHTLQGAEQVVSVDLFGERVTLRSGEHGSRTLPLVSLRDEVSAARTNDREQQ